MIHIKRDDVEKGNYKFDFKLGKKSEKNYKTIKDTQYNFEYSKVYEETFNSELYKSIFRDKFIRNIFGIKIKESVYLEFKKSINELNSKNYLICCNILKQSNSKKINKPNKYKYLLSTVTFYQDIKDLYYCNREDVNYKYNILRFLSCFEYLHLGGNLLISLFDICDPKSLNIIYLGLKLFEYLNIYIESTGLIFLYYKNFNPIIKINKFKEYLDGKSFHINNKPKLDDIEYIYKENVNSFSHVVNLYHKKEFEKFNLLFYKNILKYIEYVPSNLISSYKTMLQFYLFKIYKSIFDGKKLIKVHSSVNFKEGQFIFNMIKKHDYKKCAEVGLAFGISAMYILHAIHSYRNNYLISIDPCQTEQWKNMGVKLIKEAGLSKNHTLMEEKSYTALPKLLEKYGEGSFDFIFIDGWHTFDYTLVDFFYADLLVRVGGMIIVDDVLHSGVNRFENYVKCNYDFYRKLESPKTVGCFKKLRKDDRSWDFHRDF